MTSFTWALVGFIVGINLANIILLPRMKKQSTKIRELMEAKPDAPIPWDET